MATKKGKSKIPQAFTEAADQELRRRQEAEEAEANAKEWREQAEANLAKAQESQARDERRNAQREENLRWREGEARREARENKKWEKDFEAILARGKREGILESQEFANGSWCVFLEDSGAWKEVQDSYYCRWCEKHLNDHTLEAHLNSEGHRKKLAWNQPTPCSPCRPGVTPSCSSSAKTPGAAEPMVNGEWQGELEPWMEMDEMGVRCTLCNKVVDTDHLNSEAHMRRLEYWQENEKFVRSGRPAPELPYLAWVPWDEAEPEGERCLKCLLCCKWVQDNTSHSGTWSQPAGSKEHKKHLMNCSPEDPWYIDNVVRERQRWHPQAAPAAAERAKTGPVPKAPPVGNLPPGWESTTAPDGRPYFFNREQNITQWERPARPAPPPPPPREVPHSDLVDV